MDQFIFYENPMSRFEHTRISPEQSSDFRNSKQGRRVSFRNLSVEGDTCLPVNYLLHWEVTQIELDGVEMVSGRLAQRYDRLLDLDIELALGSMIGSH